jgi:hypothetical protein
MLPLAELGFIPVVAPDFILLDFILPDFILVPVAPGPTLPSLDAPGAGCVCADAIAVAPNNEATTRAEMASLDRMRNLRFSTTMTQNLQPGFVFLSGGGFFAPEPAGITMEPAAVDGIELGKS